MDTAVNDTTIYAASLREDTSTRKIYIIKPNDTLEKLIYDFSLNIGDTVTFFNNVTGFCQKGILDSIDYIEINNVCTKRYFLKDSLLNEGWLDVWIEGIGSQHGLIYPGVFFVDYGPYFGLWYVIKNQDTIFQNTDIIQCFTNIQENKFLQTNGICLYPNPIINDGFNLSFQTHEPTFIQIKLYDYLGREVLFMNENKQQGVYKKYMPTNNLPPGLYFLTVTINEKICSNKIIIF